MASTSEMISMNKIKTIPEKVGRFFVRRFNRLKTYLTEPKPPTYSSWMKRSIKIPKIPVETRTAFERIVRASFNQKSLVMPVYKEKYIGVQCTTMALTAALYNQTSKGVDKWSQQDVDRVLLLGNYNHYLLRDYDLLSTNKDGKIGLEDLPHTFVLGAYDIKTPSAVRLSRTFAGLVDFGAEHPFADDLEYRSSFPSLIDILGRHLKFYRPVVATIGEFSICFMKVGEDIWLFDSHGRDEKGQKLKNGTAFIAPFRTLSELASYLNKMYGANSPYNAVVLNIWTPEPENEIHQQALGDLIRKRQEEANQRRLQIARLKKSKTVKGKRKPQNID